MRYLDQESVISHIPEKQLFGSTLLYETSLTPCSLNDQTLVEVRQLRENLKKMQDEMAE